MNLQRSKKWWMARVANEPNEPISAGVPVPTDTHAAYAAPTLGERFWWKVGFRYHHGEEPEDVDALKGWMCHQTIFRFTFLDRVRLLLSGHLLVSSKMHLDTPSPAIIKTRLDWAIRYPRQTP